MRRFILFGLAGIGCTCVTVRGNVADFSDLSLPGANTYSNDTAFSSHGISFNNTFDSTYGSWNGFSYSNVADVTTPGYGNQYASYAGGAVAPGTIYAVAYPSSVIDLPAGQRPGSVELTNTTYAGLSMKNGDSFAKKFGGASGNDPDFFDVTLTGYSGEDATGSTTGAVTFYLADYRFSDNAKDYIVNQWTPVDLSPLNSASSISLSFASSDVGKFGINTPEYVALDNLTSVPEPTSLGLLAAAGAIGLGRRRRCAAVVG